MLRLIVMEFLPTDLLSLSLSLSVPPFKVEAKLGTYLFWSMRAVDRLATRRPFFFFFFYLVTRESKGGRQSTEGQ